MLETRRRNLGNEEERCWCILQFGFCSPSRLLIMASRFFLIKSVCKLIIINMKIGRYCVASNLDCSCL